MATTFGIDPPPPPSRRQRVRLSKQHGGDSPPPPLPRQPHTRAPHPLRGGNPLPRADGRVLAKRENTIHWKMKTQKKSSWVSRLVGGEGQGGGGIRKERKRKEPGVSAGEERKGKGGQWKL